MAVRQKNKKPNDAIDFIGGRLCLDFVNTADWVNGNPRDERLINMSSIATWATRQGITGSSALGGKLEEYLELRLAIHNILTNPASATDHDLSVLNHARRGSAAPLAKSNAALTLKAGQSPDGLKRLLADSATEVALTVNPERLKTCLGENCGWMFVDESPNNRRRWCSMATCGNRAKAKRHYQMTKAST